ncbi:hypothetical protein Ahy_A01g003402 [Arachis hypogaea]|uniref:Uncharacterized protein n=1 Tax=Arachis hypogaea TaxID=3818 RepID=A0A445EST9_ARAHY|nr:hypothetical protein Ahy_A01g003402 [Arachis hypogaea]
MGLGLRNFTERNNNGQPVLDTENGEELMHMQRGVNLVLANLPPISSGTLYITTNYILNFPKHHNLFSLGHFLKIDNNAEGDGSENSDSESSDIQDLSRITKMRLVPSYPTQLFCECAELNPEPNDEEGEEHDRIFSADQMEGEEEDICEAFLPCLSSFSPEEEGYISHNPANSLDQSNGHHDLARTVLEVGCSSS